MNSDDTHKKPYSYICRNGFIYFLCAPKRLLKRNECNQFLKHCVQARIVALIYWSWLMKLPNWAAIQNGTEFDLSVFNYHHDCKFTTIFGKWFLSYEMEMEIATIISIENTKKALTWSKAILLYIFDVVWLWLCITIKCIICGQLSDDGQNYWHSQVFFVLHTIGK